MGRTSSYAPLLLDSFVRLMFDIYPWNELLAGIDNSLAGSRIARVLISDTAYHSVYGQNFSIREDTPIAFAQQKQIKPYTYMVRSNDLDGIMIMGMAIFWFMMPTAYVNVSHILNTKYIVYSLRFSGNCRQKHQA